MPTILVSFSNIGHSIVVAEDEVRVTVEPPPTGDSGSSNLGSDSSSSEDSVESNLAAPGALVSISGLLGALFFSRGRDE